MKKLNFLILAFALFIVFILPSAGSDWSDSIHAQSEQRAAYWKEKGYAFDANYMTAYAMDCKVKDIERAAFWKEKGYAFDANYMTAYAMDCKVKDIERAAFWKEKGYAFNASYMTAYAMDCKVKDIERAAFWKEKGYAFDANYMTAYAMDCKVKDIERAAYWKGNGYSFDPNYMTAYAMDRSVAEPKSPSVFAVNTNSNSSISTKRDSSFSSSTYQPATGYSLPTAENGSYYGEPNKYGIPKTVYVNGYYRDGTYVRSYYRSSPSH